MKKKIKKFLKLIGIEINYYRPNNNRDVLFLKMLTEFNIDVIFDIGANQGQFGGILRDIGYKGRIISFEPLTEAHKKLVTNSYADKLWQIAPKIAIGDIDGEISINVAKNSESSSILNILKSHTDADINSEYIGIENVRISKLDSLYENYVDSNSNIFLKIDTQGYEDRVIKGALEMIEKVKGIQLELSLTPLYNSQILFDEMTIELQNLGFELWSVMPVFHDSKTGRQLQVDATFFRPQ